MLKMDDPSYEIGQRKDSSSNNIPVSSIYFSCENSSQVVIHCFKVPMTRNFTPNVCDCIVKIT